MTRTEIKQLASVIVSMEALVLVRYGDRLFVTTTQFM